MAKKKEQKTSEELKINPFIIKEDRELSAKDRDFKRRAKLFDLENPIAREKREKAPVVMFNPATGTVSSTPQTDLPERASAVGDTSKSPILGPAALKIQEDHKNGLHTDENAQPDICPTCAGVEVNVSRRSAQHRAEELRKELDAHPEHIRSQIRDLHFNKKIPLEQAMAMFRKKKPVVRKSSPISIDSIANPLERVKVAAAAADKEPKPLSERQKAIEELEKRKGSPLEEWEHVYLRNKNAIQILNSEEELKKAREESASVDDLEKVRREQELKIHGKKPSGSKIIAPKPEINPVKKYKKDENGSLIKDAKGNLVEMSVDDHILEHDRARAKAKKQGDKSKEIYHENQIKLLKGEGIVAPKNYVVTAGTPITPTMSHEEAVDSLIKQAETQKPQCFMNCSFDNISSQCPQHSIVLKNNS